MLNKQIIALPAYTFPLRLSQIIIAILVLILNIISTVIILGGYGALSFGIFTPIATCVIVAYWYFANYPAHNTTTAGPSSSSIASPWPGGCRCGACWHS